MEYILCRGCDRALHALIRCVPLEHIVRCSWLFCACVQGRIGFLKHRFMQTVMERAEVIIKPEELGIPDIHRRALYSSIRFNTGIFLI